MYKHVLLEELPKTTFLKDGMLYKKAFRAGILEYIVHNVEKGYEVYMGKVSNILKPDRHTEVSYEHMPMNPLLFSANYENVGCGYNFDTQNDCLIQTILMVDEGKSINIIPIYRDKDIGFNLPFFGWRHLKGKDMCEPFRLLADVAYIGRNGVTARNSLIETMASVRECSDYINIMNCKNVSLKRVAPDGMEKRNKKRRKTHKPLLDYYHILTFNPGKMRKIAGGESRENVGEMPLHICRGHFKEYTAEKPLFGKVTGRFWWQPFARGDLKNGIVDKDYKLRRQKPNDQD